MWHYGPGWGMMGGWSGFGGYGAFGMIVWLLILAGIVAAVVWIFRAASTQGNTSSDHRSSGLDLLEERYARGEINRDEYLLKKRDLSERSAA